MDQLAIGLARQEFRIRFPADAVFIFRGLSRFASLSV